MTHASRTIGGRQQQVRSFSSLPGVGGGEGSKQRPPMWFELNVYHVQGQWVTYFRECSFIRLKIYYQQPPTSPHFFFSVCLGRCEAGAGLSFSFPFWRGGRIFLTKAPRVLNFGAICMETLIDPWVSFDSRLDALPLL